MDTIIYYDFTSAEAFALSEVASALDPMPGQEWRGVEVEPGLPVPMQRLDRRSQERIELDAPNQVWRNEAFRIVMPKGRPNTRAALTAVESVQQVHRGRAFTFRAALFRAYWQHGEDLSSTVVIQRVADESGVPRWVDLADANATASLARWELDWRTEGLGGVPRGIRADGQILWSVKDETSAREFLLGR